MEKQPLRLKINQNLMRSLAASVTAEKEASILRLTLKLMRAVLKEVNDSFKASIIKKVLEPEISDFSTFLKKLQTDYYKWH